ncbi:MAG TPA: homogentisate 1,2-dioxygenase [Elusimicrobiota bacterium]|nr:homogentisate 1,2-dioxygenase [Elusimicrobiota bacterium]
MALILKRGEVPKTPHTEFYVKPGVLALEEIHGSYGFSGAYSRKMHVRRYPTEILVQPATAAFNLSPRIARPAPLQPYHIRTGRLPYGGDFVRSRKVLLWGPTTSVAAAKPTRSMPEKEFFRNGDGHEAVFVQEGSGILATEYGEVPFGPEDYLIIPKGTTVQWRLQSSRAFFLIMESVYPIHFAPHYVNPHGQATLMAPIVETEITAPRFAPPIDKQGRYTIWTKHGSGRVTKFVLGHHPFDLAGWEGALYPFAFSSASHHSIAREIHTAPPARQTFQAGQAPYGGFSVCTFRAQVEGWHPKDIPAPYAHYNTDCDEAMFFSNTAYGARRGVIEPGSLTFHPGAIPHSPQGNAALESRKARGKLSSYLAVMLDTYFENLRPTQDAVAVSDKSYPISWARLAAASRAETPSA